MEKIYPIIRRISFYIVAIMPILAVTYFLLLRFGLIRDSIPLPIYLQVTHVLTPMITFGSYLFFLSIIVLSLSVSEKNRSLFQRIILSIGTLFSFFICYMYSYITLSYPEKIHNSAELDKTHYYLTVQHLFGEIFTNYNLYKCNEKDLDCENLFDHLGGPLIEPSALIVDQSTKEIRVYISEIEVHSYKTNSFDE